MSSNSKISIMQPYLFPFIGYFQLINAVDIFILYDDVNFIKQGWVNRNKILNNNEPLLFSLPVEAISSNKKICETKINRLLYERWCSKFKKLIETNYKKALFYSETTYLIDTILDNKFDTISELNNFSIKKVAGYLTIKANIKSAVENYNNQNLGREERLIDICLKENSNQYLNTMGGVNLYNPLSFAKHGLSLFFLKAHLQRYQQFKSSFVPGLSIIDVLMFNDKVKIREMLNDYSIE